MQSFVKYHGLGNDFIVVEAPSEAFEDDWVDGVCDRRRGVGADGVLFVTPSPDSAFDGRMVLRNRDGSRPEMCGNGIRCAARHLVEQLDRSVEGRLAIRTDAGPRTCTVQDRSDDAWGIGVDVGEVQVGEEVSRTVEGRSRRFLRVDVGNPHAVSFGSETDAVVDAFGEALSDGADPEFPDGVNLEFAKVTGRRALDVVVFERGVGRTLACGTGACAAAAAAWATDRCDSDAPASVRLPGGVLEVERRSDGHVWLTGPAVAVFSGELYDTSD